MRDYWRTELIEMDPTQWAVYILECKDGTYYTGCTNNIARRVRQHNAGTASKYTRGRTPVDVVYLEYVENKRRALRREAAIKKLKRVQKVKLIEGSY